ncbi:hypothetical protein P13BB106kb_p049 [Pectobacterium phage DU_PP_V]|uniref:Uncharacterized protein n=1 Tax=Pectobacterium phage DU_PP_V TaxID=2041492 RepID=A0A2D2W735_9CAUD|nr:hypothetical protein HOS40_gp120 [Pectobacterium phage DU_PP_V]ATS94033.1 hypothetical protein P13BB106kb_p049 [Pectobacterium phage DU_PP_V]
MELFTTPAINLLGVSLFSIKVYRTDDTVEQDTIIVPEFFVERFFEEYEGLRTEDLVYLSEDDAQIIAPSFMQYVFTDRGQSYSKVELIEIEWAICFEVGSPFPRYHQGYEIR